MAATPRPRPRPSVTDAINRAGRAPGAAGDVLTTAANARPRTRVASRVTGSPANAWRAVTRANTAIGEFCPSVAGEAGLLGACSHFSDTLRVAKRSTAQSTQGIAAADHDRLGKLPVETIGPDNEKAIAPSADASAANRRRRKSHAPRAASGNGVAIQRLNPTTSLPINRTARAGSRNSW